MADMAEMLHIVTNVPLNGVKQRGENGGWRLWLCAVDGARGCTPATKRGTLGTRFVGDAPAKRATPRVMCRFLRGNSTRRGASQNPVRSCYELILYARVRQSLFRARLVHHRYPRLGVRRRRARPRQSALEGPALHRAPDLGLPQERGRHQPEPVPARHHDPRRPPTRQGRRRQEPDGAAARARRARSAGHHRPPGRDPRRRRQRYDGLLPSRAGPGG